MMENFLKDGCCLITGYPVSNHYSEETYFFYSVNVNENEFTLRFSNKANWLDEKNLKPKDRGVLKALLYNNNWPLERETIITPELISRIISVVDYPKYFEQKLDSYLLKQYQNGGGQYKPFKIDTDDFLSAYAEDRDEFQRIIRGLVSKTFIQFAPNEATYTFLEAGIERGKLLEEAKKLEDPRLYRDSKPQIAVVYVEKDKFYGEKLKKLLEEYGFIVTTLGSLDNLNSGDVTIFNSRKSIYGDELNYMVFIKSKASDKNNSFGSLLDVSIEAHDLTEKRNYNFIYIACVDDTRDSGRPRLTSYYHTFFDFRIVPQRKRFIKQLNDDWSRRNPIINYDKSPYKFPVVNLSPHEKRWMNAVYQKFLNNEDFRQHQLLAKIWDKVPEDFEPEKINPALMRGGSSITILGIWLIHPESPIISKFDKVVYAIREILRRNNKEKQVLGSQIMAEVVDITLAEIRQIFSLLSDIGGFSNSFGRNNDSEESSIGVDADEIYRNYRKYSGIENLVKEQYSVHLAPKDRVTAKPKVEKLSSKINIDQLDSFKSKIVFKKEIKPVMGVLELAKYLSSIIQGLPEEKGQMFGIFGRWGRGKTVLLNEIWNNISKTNRFIKIDYHAWKYQETPASWAYLYQLCIKQYLGEKTNFLGGGGYLRRLFKLNRKRLGYLPIIKFFLAAFGAIVVSPVLTFLAIAYKNWYFLTPIPILFVPSLIQLIKSQKELSTKAIDLIRKYTVKYDYAKALGIQAEIQEELIKLLQVLIPENRTSEQKVLLCVEDIDRCYEDKIIQIIDSLRIMLEDEEISKRVIIITTIDERILKNSIRSKYNSFLEATPESNQNVELLTTEYLDKLFISAIKLGELTKENKQEFLDELLKMDIGDGVIEEAKRLEEREKVFKELKGSMPDEVIDKMISDSGFMEHRRLVRNLLEGEKRLGNLEMDLAVDKGDLVEKDGDLAEEDQNGNIYSKRDINQKVTKRIVRQGEFQNLTVMEYKIFKNLVLNWKSSTPRKIRIFYYRFLLCKNILIDKYWSKVNYWQNIEGVSILMEKILQHTIKHDPENITNEKINIQSETAEEILVKQGEHEYHVDKRDYLLLLEALEMTIAY